MFGTLPNILSTRPRQLTLAFCLTLRATIVPSHAQDSDRTLDSLRSIVRSTKSDTVRVNALIEISSTLKYQHGPSALVAAREAYTLARKIDWLRGISAALQSMANGFHVTDQSDSAIHYGRLSVEADQRIGNIRALGRSYNTLGAYHLEYGDLVNAGKNLLKALETGERAKDTLGMSTAYANLAIYYSLRNEPALRLKHDLLALTIMEQQGYAEGVGTLLNNVAVDYNNLKDNKQALTYAVRAAEHCLARGDKSNGAAAYLTQAVVLGDLGDNDGAATTILKAIELLHELGTKDMLSDAYGNLGFIRMSQGKFAEAQRWLERALQNAVSVNDPSSQVYILGVLGTNASRSGDHNRALKYLEQALPMALRDSTLLDIKHIYTGIQEAYVGMGRFDKAYEYSQLYLDVHDSLYTKDGQEQLSLIRTEFETEKKELAIDVLSKENKIKATEIDRQKVIRNSITAGLFGLLLFTGVVFVQKRRITKEKARSEELLLNILPEEVAEELKQTGAAQARHFDKATILFTDFKGFTTLSERLTPTELVAELDTCFKAFDHIITARGIEKIKTIGDAYMCAGGLPDPTSSTPSAVVLAGLEMQAFMQHRKAEHEAQGKPAFEMRVGIHTGPVVAGIVGVKKFSYDIWGDTVNTASRMESSGEVGQVNISEATFALVDGTLGLTFFARGRVQAKGKGEMEMYFVQKTVG